MSGIFGYCTGDAAGSPRPIVERMAARMRHGERYRIDIDDPAPNVSLGRIGSGIFNAAPQPGRAGPVSLWLAGELYHRDEHLPAGSDPRLPRQSVDDAGYILRAYLDGGCAQLVRLNGAFIAALWDDRTRELLIVNDRYGLYPHFYAHAARSFVVAPELKGVLAADVVPRRLDLVAVSEYVRFQQMLEDRTWFEDIRLLPPATVLRYQPDSNTLRLTRYWDWDAIGDAAPVDRDEAVTEASRLVQRAVDVATAPPQRIGLYLTGGLDSRTLLGFVRPGVPLTTFTYGDPECRDVLYAARAARRAGTVHREFPLRDGRWVRECAPLHLALTEGMHCWLNMHGMTTLDDAARHLDVMMNGWRPAGVFRVRVLQNALRGRRPEEAFSRPSEPVPVLSEPDLVQRLFEMFCRRMAWPGLTEAEAATLFGGQGNAALRWVAFDSFREAVSRTRHYPADRRAYYICCALHHRRLLSNLNVFTRSAVDVRSPYFDYDLVEFAFAVPESVRAMPDFLPRVLTGQAPALARIPYEEDDRLPHTSAWVRTPHAMVQRARRLGSRIASVNFDRTRLYADYEQYLRDDLRDWAEDLLLGERARSRGLFDPGAVAALWARHLSGRELWTIGKIAPLMTIEMVLRHLFDEDC